MIWFLIGIVLGTLFGLFISSVIVANDDDRFDHNEMSVSKRHLEKIHNSTEAAYAVLSNELYLHENSSKNDLTTAMEAAISYLGEALED